MIIFATALSATLAVGSMLMFMVDQADITKALIALFNAQIAIFLQGLQND